jgi:hypothetical protein
VYASRLNLVRDVWWTNVCLKGCSYSILAAEIRKITESQGTLDQSLLSFARLFDISRAPSKTSVRYKSCVCVRFVAAFLSIARAQPKPPDTLPAIHLSTTMAHMEDAPPTKTSPKPASHHATEEVQHVQDRYGAWYWRYACTVTDSNPKFSE